MTESSGEVGVGERRLCEYLMSSAWKVQSGLGEEEEQEEEGKEAAPRTLILSGFHPPIALAFPSEYLSIPPPVYLHSPHRLYKLTHHSLRRPITLVPLLAAIPERATLAKQGIWRSRAIRSER